MTFGRCAVCSTLNWRTAAYVNKVRPYCRRCGGNAFSFAFTLSPLERLHVLRWWIWENHQLNLEGGEGCDRWWYLKPWNVARVVWMGLTIMGRYNTVYEGEAA